MNIGKKKCEVLKRIRMQVAKDNGIDYEPCVCNYEGECSGTCPKCEEELEYLNQKLKMRNRRVRTHRTITEKIKNILGINEITGCAE